MADPGSGVGHFLFGRPAVALAQGPRDLPGACLAENLRQAEDDRESRRTLPPQLRPRPEREGSQAQENGGGKQAFPVEIATAFFLLADTDSAPDRADDRGGDLAIGFLPDLEILPAACPGDGTKRIAV